MKKTKIICSIGPASETVEVMTEMVNAGMNVARVNFSHGDYQEYQNILNVVKQVRNITGQHVGILYDTKGPDFRCGDIVEEGIELVPGEYVRIVKDNIVGSGNTFTVNHPESIDKINVGNTILLEDALMKIEVVSKEEDGITCRVIDGGNLKAHKGIAVPGVKLDLPFMSDVDREDIKFACYNEGDFIALSFVESRENILEVKKLLEEFGRPDMKIISKVESQTGVDNLAEIIDESDGIMVARGDLGVEVPIERLPIIQKNMIRDCRIKEKFVIVATEMLASMYTSPRPTRAEVTDISNAVLDGADSVMLSGESTVGKHPIEAVSYMAKICETAEQSDLYKTEFPTNNKNDITETIAKAVIDAANSLDIKALVVPTTGGHSASVISNLRPKPIILAPCPTEQVARSLSLNYGVYPIVVNSVKDNDMDNTISNAREVAIKALNLQEKDKILITGGIHHNVAIKQTNFMKIEEI